MIAVYAYDFRLEGGRAMRGTRLDLANRAERNFRAICF
jgi:hypothetical protein